MCKSIPFETLDQCLSSKEVQEGDVRVHVAGTPPPGIYVPFKGDSAREMELDQVRTHFRMHKAAG